MTEDAGKTDPNRRRRLFWMMVPGAILFIWANVGAATATNKEDILFYAFLTVLVGPLWCLIAFVSLLYTIAQYGWRQSGPAAIAAGAVFGVVTMVVSSSWLFG